MFLDAHFRFTTQIFEPLLEAGDGSVVVGQNSAVYHTYQFPLVCTFGEDGLHEVEHGVNLDDCIIGASSSALFGRLVSVALVDGGEVH